MFEGVQRYHQRTSENCQRRIKEMFEGNKKRIKEVFKRYERRIRRMIERGYSPNLMAHRPIARTALRTKSTSTSVAYSLNSNNT